MHFLFVLREGATRYNASTVVARVCRQYTDTPLSSGCRWYSTYPLPSVPYRNRKGKGKGKKKGNAKIEIV